MRLKPASGIGQSAADSVAQSFVDFVLVWNATQGHLTPSLHHAIVSWLGRSWDAGLRRLLLMVFRGAGKSTIVGLFCAWLLSRNPDLRILVLSADQALATKMTRTVRRVVTAHPGTNHLVPDNTEWAADRFTVRRRGVHRDPSLLARGVGGNVTGSRADVVICDDVEVPRTSDTPGKRESLREILRELAFIMVPGGLQLYAGTPHAYDSIYAERTDEPPFLSDFVRLVVPVVDAEGKSAWPERFPLDHLESMRLTTGPAQFRSQMLLVPSHDRETRLDPDRLVVYDSELETVSANGRTILRISGQSMASVACWWDPALGRTERGDASVVAVVFRDVADGFWLHDIAYLRSPAQHGPGEPDEATVLCRQVVEFMRTNEVPQIEVEANGIGGFLPGILRRELAAAGLAAVVRATHSSRPKVRRILEGFDPVLAARRLRAHRRVWTTPFIEELRAWAPHGGGRDDGLDAVAGCLGLQPVPVRPAPPGLLRPAWRANLGGQALTRFEP